MLLVVKFTHCMIVSYIDHYHGCGTINDIYILCTNLWMCLHVLVLAFVEFATHVVQQCTVLHACVVFDLVLC